MEQYVTLERAIACPRASVSVAAETAAHALSSAGYRRGLGFGPTASYVRVYRPSWAVVVAVLGAVPTVGLSLLLFLVRKKDHCNVVIEDGPYGVVALVSGRVPVTLPAALEAAGTEQPGGRDVLAGHGQQGQPGYAGDQGGYGQGGYAQPGQGGYAPGQGGYAPGQGPYGGQGGYAQGGYGQGAALPPPVVLTPNSIPERAASHTPQQILRPATPPGALPAAAEGSLDAVAGIGRPGAPAVPPGQPFGGAAVRPPSRLAPPVPDDSGSPWAADAPPPPPQQAPARPAEPQRPPQPVGADEDPFSSTSGRVPWAVGGGRPAVPNAPAQPAAGPVPPAPAPAPQAEPPVHARMAPAQPGPVASPIPPMPVAPAPVAAPVAPAAGVNGVNGSGGGPNGAALAGATVPFRAGAVVAEAPQPVLRVDNGETLEVGPFVLLGREPVARPEDPPARLVRFDDAKLSVSKTHLAYGIDGQGLWVIDRGSTNGTTIVDPTGTRTACAPGVRHYVSTASIIQIGQRRITVEGPAA